MITNMLLSVAPENKKAEYRADPAPSKPCRIVAAGPPERHSTPLILKGDNQFSRYHKHPAASFWWKSPAFLSFSSP